MVQEKEIKNNLEQEKSVQIPKVEKSASQVEKETVVERLDFVLNKKAEELSASEEKTDGEILGVAHSGSNQLGDQFSVRQKKIEKIMEDGLADIYKSLSPAKKIEFKTVGEKTAYQVNVLLGETKVRIKKVIELIINWLKIIPGVNAFFLEKEAKIKVEEMIKLKNEKGGESK